MNLPVLPPSRRVTEGPATLPAHVGRPSRVSVPARTQGWLLRRAASTCWAPEGPLSGVSDEVVEEREGLEEGLPTVTAPEGRLPRVATLLPLASRAGCAGLAALGAPAGAPSLRAAWGWRKPEAAGKARPDIPRREGFSGRRTRQLSPSSRGPSSSCSPHRQPSEPMSAKFSSIT